MKWTHQPNPACLEGEPGDFTGRDRRKEKRRAAEGRVDLSFDDPLPNQIQAHLLDIGGSGFRTSHHCALLQTGQEVHFRHAGAEGRARVAWNRVLPRHIETGFLILSTAPTTADR